MSHTTLLTPRQLGPRPWCNATIGPCRGHQARPRNVRRGGIFCPWIEGGTGSVVASALRKLVLTACDKPNYGRRSASSVGTFLAMYTFLRRVADLASMQDRVTYAEGVACTRNELDLSSDGTRRHMLNFSPSYCAEQVDVDMGATMVACPLPSNF
jgi:hypothetical protein